MTSKTKKANSDKATGKKAAEKAVVEVEKTPEQLAIDARIAATALVAQPFEEFLLNVINNTDVGQTVALYDTGADFDAEAIVKEAAEFVINGLIGSLCYNVHEGYRGNGAKNFQKAFDDMRKAGDKDSWQRSEKSAEILHGRIVWCAKMDLQQVYRKALQQPLRELYGMITGERYQPSNTRSKSAPDSPEQNVIARINARRSAGLNS